MSFKWLLALTPLISYLIQLVLLYSEYFFTPYISSFHALADLQEIQEKSLPPPQGGILFKFMCLIMKIKHFELKCYSFRR